MANQLSDRELNSKLFKERLRAIGKSQKELGTAMGFKEKTFSAYLPEGNFDDATLKAIADTLGVQVGELWACPIDSPGEESIDYQREYYAAISRENKLLREMSLNSDVLSTGMEAVHAQLKEIYLEVKKQRELSEQMLAIGKGRLRV